MYRNTKIFLRLPSTLWRSENFTSWKHLFQMENEFINQNCPWSRQKPCTKFSVEKKILHWDVGFFFFSKKQTLKTVNKSISIALISPFILKLWQQFKVMQFEIAIQKTELENILCEKLIYWKFLFETNTGNTKLFAKLWCLFWKTDKTFSIQCFNLMWI